MQQRFLESWSAVPFYVSAAFDSGKKFKKNHQNLSWIVPVPIVIAFTNAGVLCWVVCSASTNHMQFVCACGPREAGATALFNPEELKGNTGQ